MITRIRSIIVAAAIAATALAGTALAQPADPADHARPVRNIVLVHGAFADGSGWRGVYDALTARGYRVTVVQNPLTSFADDVAATRRALARQDGPAILVGHSYGGAVITEAGVDDKVAGLVYISALAPDVGETTFGQYADYPLPPTFIIEEQADGFAFVNLANFRTGFAGDLNEADAAFLRDSQVPIALSALTTPLTQAAWRSRPSWYIVAAQDAAIDPRLLRRQARRIGAVTEELDASHVVFLTRPQAVADVIDRAAQGAGRAAR